MTLATGTRSDFVSAATLGKYGGKLIPTAATT